MLVKVQSRAFEFPGLCNPEQWNGSFTFALLADPQLGLYRNNHSWEEEKQQAEECIISAISANPKPAFIMILGDLVHAPVPALCSEPDATECRRVRDEQARDLVAAVDTPSKDVPVLVMPGNHDIGASPTAEAIADYEKLWGNDYFSFWVGGVKFVVANSCVFYDDSKASKEAEEQLGWLGEEFKDAAAKEAKHIFLMQHHQFYWNSWDESDDTVGTIEVKEMKKHNATSIFRLPEKWKRRLLPLLKKYKVTASFHGHLHFDSLLADEGIPQIVSSSCGFATNEARPGWRLVRVFEHGFEHEFFPVEWRTKDYPFLQPRFP